MEQREGCDGCVVFVGSVLPDVGEELLEDALVAFFRDDLVVGAHQAVIAP